MGIRELKQNPSKVLEKVKAGDEVFIAERGVRVARITKIQKGLLDELVESGEVESPTGNMKSTLDFLLESKKKNKWDPPSLFSATRQTIINMVMDLTQQFGSKGKDNQYSCSYHRYSTKYR